MMPLKVYECESCGALTTEKRERCKVCVWHTFDVHELVTMDDLKEARRVPNIIADIPGINRGQMFTMGDF